MAFYLDFDIGSDSNDGLTEATPKLTESAAIALFDASSNQTLNVRGTKRKADSATTYFTLTSLSNKIIQRWPGAAKPFLTHRLVSGSWTHIGGNVYTNTIPAGLTLSGITYGWGGATSSKGGYYGFCRRYANAVGVVAAASGAKGKFYYETVTTGLITAYFGGEDPNTSGKEVGYQTTETTDSAFRFVSCNNILVSGFKIGPIPKYTGQFGWAHRCEGSTNCVMEYCDIYDLGAHVGGTLGSDCSGCIVRNCNLYGAAAHNATYFIAFRETGTNTGVIFQGNNVKMGMQRGIDDELLDARSDAVAAVDPSLQLGAYGHANSGTGIAYELIDNNFENMDGALGAPRPWAIDNSAAVAEADRFTFNAYPLRITGGSVTNFGTQNLSPGGSIYRGMWAERRVRYITTATAPAGFGAGGLFYTLAMPDSTNYFNYHEACVFVGPLGDDDTRFFMAQGSTGGVKRVVCISCSFYNNSGVAAFCGVFDQANENLKYFEAEGCIFGNKTSGTNTCLMKNEGAAALTGNAVKDNLYHGISDAGNRYAQIAVYNAAAWVANVDTSATVAINVLAANPYASETTLAPTAAAKAKKRTTGAHVPALGINGLSYSGQFGAYQYGSISHSDGGASSDLIWDLLEVR